MSVNTIRCVLFMFSAIRRNTSRLPSVVVRASFKILHVLLDVRPRMRRFSQALEIESVKHGVKHASTVRRIF